MCTNQIAEMFFALTQLPALNNKIQQRRTAYSGIIAKFTKQTAMHRAKDHLAWRYFFIIQ